MNDTDTRKRECCAKGRRCLAHIEEAGLTRRGPSIVRFGLMPGHHAVVVAGYLPLDLVSSARQAST